MNEQDKIIIATNLGYIEWATSSTESDAWIYDAIEIIRKTLGINWQPITLW